MIRNNLEKDLKGIVGDHVTTSQFERWFYASDLMSIPSVVRDLFKTTPDAVVKPHTTSEVAAIARYCHQRGIPIVPRGAGSSGLFGAVPKKGGVVLDLTDLTEVIEIDRESKTAVASAGATWWQLEKALNNKQLTLISYPSSARSATLGGWVMTSGLGIGSLKYGPVFNHIISAEIVLADGTIEENIAGEELASFFETEGILGVITCLTLRVRGEPEMASHHWLYFSDIKNLFQALTPLVNTQPHPYNIEIFNDNYLNLLQMSGYPETDFAPGCGALLVTYDGGRAEIEAAKEQLTKLISHYEGTEKDDGEREWRERFNILRIKRSVPSLLVSSVYVPFDKLDHFYSHLGRLKKRTVALFGHVISHKDCNLMPMVATDERHPLEYLFALHTPSEVVNLALSSGGRPGGGLGVWNAPYKKELLGNKRIAEIKRLKAELDPRNIMNPGMWLEPPIVFQSVPYRLITGVASILDKVLPTQVSSLVTSDFQQELSACVQCGYCMNVCPTKLAWLSSTPRGRINMTRQLFLKNPHHSEKMALPYLNRIFQCTLCGRCQIDCNSDIRSRPMWLEVRHFLAKNGLEVEGLKSLVALTDETHNIAGRPNEQRTNWATRTKLSYLTTKKTAEYVYFVGCVSSFFPIAQSAARAFVQILDTAGIDLAIIGGEEWCCGFPLMSAGHHEMAVKCLRHNIDRLKEIGAKSLVMTCPGCYRVWKDEYLDILGQKHPFNVYHSTELMEWLIESGRILVKGLEDEVTYHDPCDLGRNGGIFDQPRNIIRKIPGLDFVELEDNREYCSCCGSGGDLLASSQELSLAIARRKVNEIMNTGTQTVITACPSCVRAIHMAKTTAKVKLEVLDITELLWKAMGN